MSIPTDLPLHPPAASVLSEPSLVDLLLRDRDQADRACADPATAARLLPRFIGLSALGIGAWSVVHGLLLSLSTQQLNPHGLFGAPITVTIPALFLAYEGALTGAQVAGLPTFSFYGLMAGFRTHAWRIATESLRARATAALVLMGLLPVYLAVGLGLVLLFPEPGGVGAAWQALVLGIGGFTLPFVAGLAAPASLLRVFRKLAHEAEDGRPGQGRRPMPLLLAMAWSAVFSVMAPLGVLRILTVLVG